MRKYLIAAAMVGSAMIALVARGVPLGPLGPTRLVADADVEAKAKGEGWREAVARLEAEVRALRDSAPQQSYVMLGVADQFANLWYATEQGNWPLAEFFLEETGEGIEWAVKIEPIHRDPQGRDIDLAAIFQSLQAGIVPELKASIAARDRARFGAAYRNMLQGCYGCHTAIGKAFLRPKIPSEPATRIINFDPNASWPP